MSTKEDFLNLLKNNESKVLSGEEAAAALGVSRNAIWKAANSLRKEGLNLEAVSGGGYRYIDSSDLFTSEAIRLYLADKNTEVRVFDSLDSTLNYGKKWAIEGAPHGSIVIAKEQTGGKGRLGRTFKSPPGGLYMSFIMKPQSNTDNAVLITAASAVAACRAVSQLCSIELSIKWVNDLFYNGKKCCGILTEGITGLENGQLEYIICGIGINYTVPQDAFDGELANIATSLYPNSTPPVSAAQLVAKVHDILMEYADNIADRAFMDEYKSRNFLIGQHIRVMSGTPYNALAVGIDDNARLIVKDENGETKIISYGEVSVLKI